MSVGRICPGEVHLAEAGEPVLDAASRMAEEPTLIGELLERRSPPG